MESDNAIVTQRALSLFTYLRELAQLGSAITRRWSEYDDVLWLHGIPEAPEVKRMAWRDPEAKDHPQVWIEIKKPELKDPPKFPIELKLWVDATAWRDSELNQPSLRPAIRNQKAGRNQPSNKKPPDQLLTLDDHPEISDLWKKYVEEKWKPWAAEDRKRRSVQKAYEGLFSFFQKQQQEAERYELVVSLGLLAWKPNVDLEIHRHILTAQTHISFDSAGGIISVNAAGEGAKLTLEQDMLEDPPHLAGEGLNQELSEIGDAIWESTKVGKILSKWINWLSPRGRYHEALEPQENALDFPTIHLAPALVLRRRGEKGYLSTLKEILKEIEEGVSIPEGVQSLVGIHEVAAAKAGNSDRSPDEIYFPKPANEEQEKIVHKLQESHGLVVQGPPGTGKSHTIANLICHCLATGKRVLVTSHSPRALRVLKDKFPQAVAPLCIMLLDDDRKALKELEDSVGYITKAYGNWNAIKNGNLINELEHELGKIRAAQSEILRKLGERRNAETATHDRVAGAYRGSLAEIARQLKKEENQNSWIPDALDENSEVPLSNEEAQLLLALLREKTRRNDELRFRTVDPSALAAPHDFSQCVTTLERLRSEWESSAQGRSHIAFLALMDTPRDVIEDLRAKIIELKSKVFPFLTHETKWIRNATAQVLARQALAWKKVVQLTEQNLEVIEEFLARSQHQEISGVHLVNRDHGQARTAIRNDAAELLAHLESGGNLGFWIFRPKIVRKCKKLIEVVQVDGKPCDNPEALKNLLAWVDVMDRIELLKQSWTGMVGPVPAAVPAVLASHYRSRCETLSEIFSIGEKMQALRDEVFAVHGVPEPLWGDITQVDALLAAIETVHIRDRISLCERQLQEIEDKLGELILSSDGHPTVHSMSKAIVDRNPQSYAECHDYLSELWAFHKRCDQCNHLLEHLRVSAPLLVEHLTVAHEDHEWENRLALLREAWNWTRCNSWLRARTQTQEQENLSHELQKLRDEQAGIMEKLVAEKAWRHCFEKMTNHELTHLKAWKQEMKLVGKGTGTHAPRHRGNAKKHMKECRSAIPAWIMPIYRVAQTVSPRAELFDVVVVDEASQAGPEALFLTHLAKKMVIVGDDKQISPDTFVDQSKVERLQKLFLDSLPNNHLFGVEHSLFDIAKIFYAGLIRLTEHFRCMPEIIQFSNNLCYRDNPLVPLRQHGIDRLPPVQVVYVPNGYQKGDKNVINPPEAELVVEKIAECIEDKRYENKSMGVISLLGRTHSQYVEELLRKRIGPMEMSRRRLVCGEPYAFQGDERDVIFLSMVRAASEGKAVTALTLPQHERRFNVAASRARDQMWLFHSVSLNDLRKDCLRYNLINYFYNPYVQVSPEFDGLLSTIGNGRRSTGTPPDPFDSWFEVDVFEKIARKGFRVIPQFRVGGYFIDLVVEGMRGRIAVECDGDAYHGPDRYDRDMSRQRDLERCGWQFWRIRASSFYREPDSSLESLWRLLANMNIHPGANR